MSELPIFNFVRTHANRREQAWAAEESNTPGSGVASGSGGNDGSGPRLQQRTPTTWSRADTLVVPGARRIQESSRTLSRMRQEKSLPHSQELDRLVKILKENKVPGPQLFRLESEFCQALGEGGSQGTVYGISRQALRKYRAAVEDDKSKTLHKLWNVDVIAIKRYKRAKTVTNAGLGDSASSQSTRQEIEEQLSNRFRDAACEAFALSPERFRNHRNIVQLKGWGLCLDTLENHASSCCQSLQVPMLILEKADMDLAQFLQHKLFPERDNHHTSYVNQGDIETGDHGDDDDPSANGPLGLMGRASIFVQDPYEIVRLLCIDIGHGLGAIHRHQFSHGDLKPANILVFRPGTSEIAEGKINTKWMAKICDFGLSSGEDVDDPDTGVAAWQTYAGSPGWFPPPGERDRPVPAEQLRKCDVYVYGLVVWSAFCLRGAHRGGRDGVRQWDSDKYLNQDLKSMYRWWARPDTGHGEPDENTPRTRVSMVYHDVLGRYELGKKVCSLGISQYAFGRYGLRKKIEELVQGAMAPPSQRNMTPWESLYTSSWEKASYSEANQTEQLSSPERADTAPQLITAHPAATTFKDGVARVPRAGKELYNEMPWWKPPKDSNASGGITGDESQGPGPSDVDDPDGVTMSSTMVSQTERDTDDIPLSLEEFKTERRHKEVGEVARSLHQLVKPAPASTPTFATHKLYLRSMRQHLKREPVSIPTLRVDAGKLYLYARYRSRFPREWSVPNLNILEHALMLRGPAVDTCTLAWLAEGSIGRSEVERAVWDDVLSLELTDTGLDESERLSRVLLLMHIGAPVQRGVENCGNGETFLMLYLEGCRSAIIPVVVTQLYRACHLDVSSPSTKFGGVPLSTKVYVAEGVLPRRLLADMYKSDKIDSATYEATKMMLAQQFPGIEKQLRGQQTYLEYNNTLRFREPDEPNMFYSEHASLLTARPAPSTPNLPLPPGWIEHRSGGGQGSRYQGPEIYQEVFSQSFTLKRPTSSACSLVQRGEIKIGDLNPKSTTLSYLSLPSMPRGNSNTKGSTAAAATTPRPGDDDFFQLVDARFPIYNQKWFTSEWLLDLPDDDILGTIRDPWWKPIPSFISRISTPNLNIFQTIIFSCGWLLTEVLWPLVQGLATVLFWLVVVAAGAALVAAVLWLIWPILFIKLLAFGPFFVFLYVASDNSRSSGDGGICGLVSILLAFLSMPCGAIAAALILQAICARTPDGIKWDGKECKICPWVSFEYLNCNLKPDGT
ncbi:hypothetical protein QBC37DRAFT_430029 [Rhypophila decipiens]|uniref:Protein kinase domain-containing protein n=1 Tax=Rhypophila decipiens TaxID=261697 RepID=A0AAN7B3K6_9PEZI|nr:hypothetical protein QBC37DRAFT_430029 [Rhypophila decipiens]